jgi:hypothetical protein
MAGRPPTRPATSGRCVVCSTETGYPPGAAPSSGPPRCVNHCAPPYKATGTTVAARRPMFTLPVPELQYNTVLGHGTPRLPGLTVTAPNSCPRDHGSNSIGTSFLLPANSGRLGLDVTAPNLRNFLSPRTRGVDADVPATKRHRETQRAGLECTCHLIVNRTVEIRNS